MTHRTRLAVIVHCDVVDSTHLVRIDERLAHDRMQAVFRKISTTFVSHGGKAHEIRGDALLAEFGSVTEAVTASLAFQESNFNFNRGLNDNIKPEVRIGIAIGEIVVADSTVTGTGVILAQRLEQLANANSVVIQSAVKDALPARLPFKYDSLGVHSLKGFEETTKAYIAKYDRDTKQSERELSTSTKIAVPEGHEAIRYCSSSDGANIAYTQLGEGYPLVAVGSWMTHLEEDWFNPIWGAYIRHLSSEYALIRYDQRGNGMSDWHGIEITFDKMVDDLEAVIDCFDIDQVALFGPSQAAAVSIAYANRFPNKVSHLILFGAYARGRCRRGNPEASSESHAMVTMIRQNWGNENPVARQMMTSLFFPDAESEEAKWFNNFQKTCGPGENMARYREVFDDIDVSDNLNKLNVPCLVIHSTGDSVAPIAEGKYIAARIPGAKMITVKSNSHMVDEEEPGFQQIMHAVHDFLNPSER